MFNDLGPEYTFIEKENEKRTLKYVTFEEVNKVDRIGLCNKLSPKSPDWMKELRVTSLSPVCAIVGGVAGQDMIRALSGKDIPIYNTFFFDSSDMNGTVERIGFQEESRIKPKVTDVVEFSDDDDDDDKRSHDMMGQNRDGNYDGDNK